MVNVSFKRLSMLLMFGLMISPTPTHTEEEAQNVAIQKKSKDPTGISKSAKKTGGDMQKAGGDINSAFGNGGKVDDGMTCQSDNHCKSGVCKDTICQDRKTSEAIGKSNRSAGICPGGHDRECKDGQHCVDGTCRTGRFGKCLGQSDCDDGYSCDHGICKKRVGEGADCYYDSCQKGLECKNEGYFITNTGYAQSVYYCRKP